MMVYLIIVGEDKCQVSKDKHQYRKRRTYTRRGRGNEQAKLRRDKTASSRELRYFRLEIFEIRLVVFVGNY